VAMAALGPVALHGPPALQHNSGSKAAPFVAITLPSKARNRAHVPCSWQVGCRVLTTLS
jgi:hypothetical protein